MAGPFGCGNGQPGAGQIAAGQNLRQRPFFQNPFPPPEWSAMINTADVATMVKSRPIILIIGKDKMPMRVPEDILRTVPYFDNILKTGSHPGTIEITGNCRASIGTIISWLGQAPTPPYRMHFGRIAKYSEWWGLPRIVKTCMSEYWLCLGDAIPSGDDRIFSAIKAWFLPLRKSRMRYIAVHFLVARKREMGLMPPQRVQDDVQFIEEFWKWNYLLDQAEGDGAKPYAGYRGHEILRRLIAGTLSLNWMKTELNPRIVDKGQQWLNEYLKL